MPVFAVSLEHAGSGTRELPWALWLLISWRTETIPLLELSAGAEVGGTHSQSSAWGFLEAWRVSVCKILSESRQIMLLKCKL